MRPELSYDGHGINGPDEYRSRLFTCRAARNADEQAALDRYGKLCAAAPDLLAVLERVAETVNWLSMSAELWDDMHAAIAKAKGK